MSQKVLVIDDSEAIHSLLRARLAQEAVELHFAFSGDEGLRRASELLPDLILLDIDMPQPDGFEVCRRLKADSRTMPIPVVFLSGITSTEDKIKGLELGATDYITKHFEPAELRARVRASLRSKYLLDLLARKAMIDGLTGLWNRAYFETRLTSELSLARRAHQPLACIMLDLDHFKQINDQYGHPFGDEVLRWVGQLLTETCRTEDVICRYGGEEFVVLAPNTEASAATELAERIRQTVSEFTWRCKGGIVKVTCSLGVSDLRHAPPPTLIELADAALYKAKHSGRNRVVVANPEPVKSVA
ncbi:MAG TPA: diguanylate cyclase [Tepidisphaeraceae bacterium]|nr:diguanylate cyclase [Tepidisphaeraceae bacterium]